MTRTDFYNRYGNFSNHDVFMRDLELVIKEAMRPKIENAKMLLREICQHQKQEFDNVQTKCRNRELAYCRFIFGRIAVTHLQMTLEAVGNIIGRNHSTVIYGIKQTESVREIRELYEEVYEYLKPVL